MMEENTAHIDLNRSARKRSFDFKKNLKKVARLLFSLRFISVLTLAGVGIIIYFLYTTPPYLSQLNLNKTILDEVSKLTSVNILDNTTSFAVIVDADKLRNENAIQKEVYKDAQNGDYVILFKDQMIIYRRPEKKIIYQGDSPATIANNQRLTLAQKIGKKVYDAGLIPSDKKEISVPQLSEVTDAEQTKKQSEEFFADVKVGDIIAYFPDLNLVVLYRPSTDMLINTGSYQSSIVSNTN